MVSRAASLSVFALQGVPLIDEGVALPTIIARSVADNDLWLADGDIIVIAQKIVSKAEGRLVPLEAVTPSVAAIELAAAAN